jgi:hypothetical protein
MKEKHASAIFQLRSQQLIGGGDGGTPVRMLESCWADYPTVPRTVSEVIIILCWSIWTTKKQPHCQV